MAEPYRNPDPSAPQNPPGSVVNKDVRRFALWTYLPPLIVFFLGVGLLLAYWETSAPPTRREAAEPRAEGTTGTERERSRDETPGGQNPDRTPASPQAEVEDRSGRTITELSEVFDSRDAIGRRVEVRDVDVERVESPTLFWIRDGNARVAVTSTDGGTRVQAGQSVNVAGTVERSGGAVRIRATRVEASQ
jgi:hypothetical protein